MPDLAAESKSYQEGFIKLSSIPFRFLGENLLSRFDWVINSVLLIFDWVTFLYLSNKFQPYRKWPHYDFNSQHFQSKSKHFPPFFTKSRAFYFGFASCGIPPKFDNY